MKFTGKKQFIDYLCEEADYTPPSSCKTKTDAKPISEKDIDGFDIAVVMNWNHGEKELLIIRIYKDGVKSAMVWSNYSDNGFTEDVLDNYADWSELDQIEII